MFWIQLIVLIVSTKCVLIKGFSDLVVNNKKVNLTLFDGLLNNENLTDIQIKMHKSLRPTNLLTKDKFISNENTKMNDLEYVHIIPKPQTINSYSGYFPYVVTRRPQKTKPPYLAVTTTIRPYETQIDDRVEQANLLTFLNRTLIATTEAYENSIEDPPYPVIDVTHPTAFIQKIGHNKYFDGNYIHQYPSTSGISSSSSIYPYITTDYPIQNNQPPLQYQQQVFSSTTSPPQNDISSTINLPQIPANSLQNLLGWNRPQNQNPVFYLNYNSEVNRNRCKLCQNFNAKKMFIVYD